MFRIYLYVLLATAFTAGAVAETHTIVVGGSTATFEDTTVCGNMVDGEPGEQIYGDWTNNGGNTVQDECPVDCPGDIDGDQDVDIDDFSVFLVQFGQIGAGLSADIDGDQDVDIDDFSAFLINFGNDCNAPLRAAPVKTKRKQKQTH